MTESVILSKEDIRRAVVRMAHEILERKGEEELVAIGIRTRGFPLAQRIAEVISRIEGRGIPVGAIDFTLYRDDLDSLPKNLMIEPSDIPGRIADRRVILIDDVLNTGRSARAAIDALIGWGRPGSIQLAVLVDRGHREMPIKADYVGKNIPSSTYERVQVRLREIDGRDEVVIIGQELAPAAGGNRK